MLTELTTVASKHRLLIASAFTGLLIVALVSLYNSIETPKQQPICDRNHPNAEVDLVLPKVEQHDDDVQLTITLPCRYLRDEYDYAWSLRSVNYKTDDVSDGAPPTVGPDFIRFNVREKPYPTAESLFRPWQAYELNGEERYGLSYAPQVVPSRPETHWKVGYFKPGVSGDDFHIRCSPEAEGFEIKPQKWCAMVMMLNPTEVHGRPWAASVLVTFNVERLEDWQEIEAKTRDIFSQVVLN